MTIISNSRGFLFIHVQKCGGSSVESAYARYQRWNDLILGSTPLGERKAAIYKEEFGLHKHSTAAQLVDILGPEVFRGFEVIALVRRPDRIFQSFYKWGNKMIANHVAETETSLDTLRNFARNDPSEYAWPALSWIHIRGCLLHETFSGYATMLMDSGFRARPSRYLRHDGQVLCPNVYRLEEPGAFEEHFGRLVEDPGFQLPVVNKGESLDPDRMRWEPSALTRFLELHADEYDRYGYRVEDVSPEA